VFLVNTTAVKQCAGLKYREDDDDARWLAHLLHWVSCPYICPKAERGVRGLMRKRGRLVRQRSQPILSVENALSRELGAHEQLPRSSAGKRADVDQRALGDNNYGDRLDRKPGGSGSEGYSGLLTTKLKGTGCSARR